MVSVFASDLSAEHQPNPESYDHIQTAEERVEFKTEPAMLAPNKQGSSAKA